MRTILFNGCSFVAGDAFCWEQYCNEMNYACEWFNISSEADRNFQLKYRYEYRRKYNLPSIVANNLGMELVDLSDDGNSNDMIAMTTINYLLTKEPHERKKYYVVIGWSSAYRRMVWLDNPGTFFSVHNNHINPKHQSENMKQLIPFVKEAIINADIRDHFYNYVSNILLLESFLKANSINYTFFRSLGDAKEFENVKIHPIKHAIVHCVPETKVENYTDHARWYKFKHSDNIPFMQNSIVTFYLDRKPQNAIKCSPGHPNWDIIKEFGSELSLQISLHIKNQLAQFF